MLPAFQKYKQEVHKFKAILGYLYIKFKRSLAFRDTFSKTNKQGNPKVETAARTHCPSSNSLGCNLESGLPGHNFAQLPH